MSASDSLVKPPVPSRCEVVVVGGGIAGLAAAWNLRDRDVVVLEANDRVGGRMRSERAGPYWANFGAHYFGSDSNVAQLATALGVETAGIDPGRPPWVELSGGPIGRGAHDDFPRQLKLSRAARLDLIRVKRRIRGAVRGYERSARPRPGEAPADTRYRQLAYLGNQSFSSYLGRLHPDVEAIFASMAARAGAALGDLSAGCGAAAYAHVWAVDSIMEQTFVGGAGELPRRIAEELGARVVTSAGVSEVTQDARCTRVRFALDGRECTVEAGCTIVATPAPVSRSIIRDLPHETAAALESIDYGPYVVAGVFTNETEAMPWDRIYALTVVDRSFCVLLNNANALRRRGNGRVAGGSLTLFGGGDLARRLIPLTDDGIARVFLNDLVELYPEAEGIVTDIVIQRWPHGYPYLGPGRHQLQEALERPLGRVFLAGDYLDFALMDTAITSGQLAARGAMELLERSRNDNRH